MNLASIERILEIRPIENADKIVACRIKGYWTVMKKEEAVQDGLIVWHEPDTVVDLTNPAYSFLKDDGRIRVRKFKKQVSQGLALPLSAFCNEKSRFALYNPEKNYYIWESTNDLSTPVGLEEGHDVTEYIGIKKYEKPLSPQLAGCARGNFPSFLIKTDETRLRSSPKLLAEFTNKNVYFSLKMDGSSATFYRKDGQFGVCSRNLDLKDTPENAFWNIARKYDIERKLTELGGNAAIQGELCGPGIQGNKIGLSEPTLYLFDVFDISRYTYMGLECLMEFGAAAEIPVAPVIWANVFNFSIEDIQNLANEQKYENGEWAEGIVIRPVNTVHSETLGGRLSAKVISENFALKHKE